MTIAAALLPENGQRNGFHLRQNRREKYTEQAKDSEVIPKARTGQGQEVEHAHPDIPQTDIEQPPATSIGENAEQKGCENIHSINHRNNGTGFLFGEAIDR